MYSDSIARHSLFFIFPWEDKSLIYLSILRYMAENLGIYLSFSNGRSNTGLLIFTQLKFLLINKNQVSLGMRIDVCGFNFMSVIVVSIFMSIRCWFYYYSSIIQFEIKDGDTSNILLLFNIIFFFYHSWVKWLPL